MSAPFGFEPDRLIVARLKRIDPDLSVAYADPPGRFAIYHDALFEGNSEQSCAQLAQGLQATYREQGYVVPFAECERQAFQKMQDQNLVCYVTEDNGDFRPLDQRIIDKLERMDFYRRNLGIPGWKEMLDAKAYAAQRQREREQEGIWESVRKDRAFARISHDLLWGIPPTRSVIVPDNLPPSMVAEPNHEGISA